MARILTLAEQSALDLPVALDADWVAGPDGPAERTYLCVLPAEELPVVRRNWDGEARYGNGDVFLVDIADLGDGRAIVIGPSLGLVRRVASSYRRGPLTRVLRYGDRSEFRRLDAGGAAAGLSGERRA